MPHAISAFAREALSPSPSRDLFEKSTGTKILLIFSIKTSSTVKDGPFRSTVTPKTFSREGKRAAALGLRKGNFEQRSKFTSLVHLVDDIAAADKFPFNKNLGNSRPV